MANNSIQGGLSATISSLAQDCIGQGLPVLPLYNDEKGPSNIAAWSTLSLAECQQRWRPARGIAKVTGIFLAPSHLGDEWDSLFIIDIDEYDPVKQRHLLEELLGDSAVPENAVTTASGGLHLYFQWPKEDREGLGSSLEICGSHVDLRGAGLGCGLVLPPSRAKVNKKGSPYCGEVRSYTGPKDLVGWLGSLPPISERTKERLSSACATKTLHETPLGEGVSNKRMLLGITSQLRRELQLIPDGSISDGKRNSGAMALGRLVGANSINPRAYSLVRDDVLAMVKPKVDLTSDGDGKTWAKFEEDFERAVGYGHNDFARNSSRLNSTRDEALKGKGQMSRAVLYDAADRLFGGPTLLVLKTRDGSPESYELIIGQSRDTWSEAPADMRAEFPRAHEPEWMNFAVRRLGLQDRIEFSVLNTPPVARELLQVLKQDGLEVSLSEAPKELFLDCLGREVVDCVGTIAPLIFKLSNRNRQKPWVELWPMSSIEREKYAVWIAPVAQGSKELAVYFTAPWLDRTMREQCNMDGKLQAWLNKNTQVVNARNAKHIAHSMPFALLPEYVQEEAQLKIAEYAACIRNVVEVPRA
jgi:bifunctional DNA primase/polymerase-like protein